MSSVAAETAMNLDLSNESSPPQSSLVEHVLNGEDLDLKMPTYEFDDSYADKAGPSSAGLEEQGYFDNLPVLEKGTGVEPAAAILPFVLDEMYIRPRAEGGWAGWTCVAGSWLVCAFPSSPGADCVILIIVFATSGYANAFGVCTGGQSTTCTD